MTNFLASGTVQARFPTWLKTWTNFTPQRWTFRSCTLPMAWFTTTRLRRLDVASLASIWSSWWKKSPSQKNMLCKCNKLAFCSKSIFCQIAWIIRVKFSLPCSHRKRMTTGIVKLVRKSKQKNQLKKMILNSKMKMVIFSAIMQDASVKIQSPRMEEVPLST